MPDPPLLGRGAAGWEFSRFLPKKEFSVVIDFFMNNIGTIAVGLGLLAVIARIVIGMRKEKKAGKSCCGGNCSCCPGSCTCHKEKE